MYRPGDYAVVSGYGVCRIDSVGHLSFSYADPAKDYYSVTPVSDSCRIHIPCDGADGKMRPIITREQAISLIMSIPGIKARKTREKYREQRYKDAISSGRPDDLLPVIIEIYQLNEDSIRKGKPISKVTEAYMFREAQSMFHSEMAYALGCSASDVLSVIRKMVATA